MNCKDNVFWKHEVKVIPFCHRKVQSPFGLTPKNNLVKKTFHFCLLIKVSCPLFLFFCRLYKPHIQGLWQSTGGISLTLQNVPISRAFIPHHCQLVIIFWNIPPLSWSFQEKNRAPSLSAWYTQCSPNRDRHILYSKHSLLRENFLMFPIWKLVGRHKIGLGEGVSSGYLLKLHRRTLYLWFCALKVNTDKLGLCIINYSVTPKLYLVEVQKQFYQLFML